uniref:Uncharacterized protein n=1 Tax=Caulobacter phage BL57 TaxID=3348355 RepID=A0AB74UGI8_9VIRU
MTRLAFLPDALQAKLTAASRWSALSEEQIIIDALEHSLRFIGYNAKPLNLGGVRQMRRRRKDKPQKPPYVERRERAERLRDVLGMDHGQIAHALGTTEAVIDILFDHDKDAVYEPKLFRDLMLSELFTPADLRTIFKLPRPTIERYIARALAPPPEDAS